MSSQSRRRFWAPEVVQTSAMDCGPAALKCMLEGFGGRVSYGRLREACQTSVDGTSIDTLEEIAQALGLDAAQIVLPPEHAVSAAPGVLPAIAVVRMPSGLTHFVVLWRRVGPWIQVMDPGSGRRWVRAATFVRDLYIHTHTIDAETFQAFATDASFTHAVRGRFVAAGGRAGGEVFDAALARAGDGMAVARLDGAARAAESLIGERLVRRGRAAGQLLRALVANAPDAIPALVAENACARPAGEGVAFRGAVLIHVAGRAAGDAVRPALPRELAAADDDERPFTRAVRALPQRLWRRRALGLLPLLPIVVALGLGEVVLSRPLLAGPATPALGRAALALLAVVLGAALLELPLLAGARGLGRTLDVGLRRAFFRKLPRLGDRYFASRPVSDMAERAHLLHRIRLLPGLGVQLGRTIGELALACAAIAWLYPPGAPLALAMLLAAGAIPALMTPALAERDLRLRTHAGALLRFYLDALLGLTAVRTHGAGAALAREHEERLREWQRAGRDVVAAAARSEAATVLMAVAGAAVLVGGSLRAPQVGLGTVFLLLFLALRIPTQASAIAGLWRQFPEHRNVTLRLLEPLGAPDDRSATPASQQNGQPQPRGGAAGGDEPRPGVALAFDDVAVEVAGHVVLQDVSLQIAAGAHVAIVGPSGAGKSTLIGLLLGLHRPARGEVRVDGMSLQGEAVAALRAGTVWVEPTVQLWNRSLADNVGFGAPLSPSAEALEAALDDAELSELVRRLPAGAATVLGEGGGLVSGGEGQRVRFARALARLTRPRLVLLDEPFRGLDRTVRRRLLARARARWADATLVVATHDIEQTRDFPRVMVVDRGRVAEDGAPDTLAGRADSIYRQLLDAEARVRATRWAAPFWRRLTVRDGRLHEGRMHEGGLYEGGDDPSDGSDV
jgi:ATP-binding cassette subfamily B protein